jgi:uncharacterized coiled-coil protein SlyX
MTRIIEDIARRINVQLSDAIKHLEKQGSIVSSTQREVTEIRKTTDKTSKQLDAMEEKLEIMKVTLADTAAEQQRQKMFINREIQELTEIARALALKHAPQSE